MYNWQNADGCCRTHSGKITQRSQHSKFTSKDTFKKKNTESSALTYPYCKVPPLHTVSLWAEVFNWKKSNLIVWQLLIEIINWIVLSHSKQSTKTQRYNQKSRQIYYCWNSLIILQDLAIRWYSRWNLLYLPAHWK